MNRAYVLIRHTLEFNYPQNVMYLILKSKKQNYIKMLRLILFIVFYTSNGTVVSWQLLSCHGHLMHLLSNENTITPERLIEDNNEGFDKNSNNKNISLYQYL